ncbi:MAG TPA: hypothetical protein HA329_04835 [Candidatus Thalassarchaeaceae archaeon]|nr:hypothetical protein [Candidatus Thalassarchaeaceae archaeon]|tara:strand:- start:6663 stop:7820 length:1158 start_codon:yes stop_codon:yes gene_type:complete
MNAHLIIPNHEVQGAIELLLSEGWLSQTLRIHSDESEKFRLVPLDGGAPQDLPPPLDQYPILDTEGELTQNRRPSWQSVLEALVGVETFEEYESIWPASHEFIGDMMLLKIEEEVRIYEEQIVKAKMESHPHVRLVLEDRGVKGEFRVRDLRPMALRIDGQIENNPSSHTVETRVEVKESGHTIICDPTLAYYSSRLQTERIQNVIEAEELRGKIGSPIAVADPFCGVGPALAHLINRQNLTSQILASDLNPEAINMLNDNLRRWRGRDIVELSHGKLQLNKDVWSGIQDARELVSNPELLGRWNMLIINLPHSFSEFLPLLLPLMDASKPYVIRGRLVCRHDEIDEKHEQLLQHMPNPDAQVVLDPRRDYSPITSLCSVTIRNP